MSAKINFALQVPVRTVKGADAPFVSCCPLLDVSAQGNTKAESRENLLQALTLFIETCYFAGTVDQVLIDAGFTKEDGDTFEASAEDDDEPLEVPFELIARSHGRQAACA